MEKHTELPWNVVNFEAIVGADETWVKPYHHDSWEGGRKWPSKAEQEANAQLIVTAVNNHASLVEALRECVEALQYEDKGDRLLVAMNYDDLLAQLDGETK